MGCTPFSPKAAVVLTHASGPCSAFATLLCLHCVLCLRCAFAMPASVPCAAPLSCLHGTYAVSSFSCSKQGFQLYTSHLMLLQLPRLGRMLLPFAPASLSKAHTPSLPLSPPPIMHPLWLLPFRWHSPSCPSHFPRRLIPLPPPALPVTPTSPPSSPPNCTPQIATHPNNSMVFERLLQHRRGGTQLTMVPATVYPSVRRARGDSPLAFGALAEEVMRCRALAIGYRRADGRMLLAPAADEEVEWGEGDELVVLADVEEDDGEEL